MESPYLIQECKLDSVGNEKILNSKVTCSNHVRKTLMVWMVDWREQNMRQRDQKGIDNNGPGKRYWGGRV